MSSRLHRFMFLICLAAPCISLQSGCVPNNRPSIGASEDLEEAATANLNLGVGYLRQGKWGLAREKLEKSVSQNPRVATAHDALALVYENLGEFDRAEEHYSRALKLEPNNAAAQNSYGVFLCRRLKRAQDAQKYFRAAADNPRYPTPEAALTNAGVCMLEVPELAAAERYFREALERNPRYPQALFQMTELSFANGEYLQARAFLARSEAVTAPAPSLLWLGIQIEEQLGDERRADNYKLRLKDRFPTSEEARKLVELERNER